VKPGRRLQTGDVVRFGDEGKVCFLGQLDATVEDKGEGGEVTLAFAFHGAVLDEAIEERGAMPLPPYIASRRAPDEQDRADYQTMFADAEGSVAAPTAGLHFTDALVDRLKARARAHTLDAARRGWHVPAVKPTTPAATACMRRPEACRLRRRRRSMQCVVGVGASWRSARPRCGSSKALPMMTVSFMHSRARPRCSSRRAIASARPT